LWTYPELADTLTQVTGSKVGYREVDEDEGALSILGLAPVIQAGGFEVRTPDLEAALGHPPTNLREAVAAALTARRAS
jgi:NAD(P)H dehydrogenase (quinone)